MKKLLLIFCLLLPQLLVAQAPASAKPTVQEKMKALDWLPGQWQGQGWISFGPNEKHTFTQTEDIRYKLDNTVLQIEGLGKNGDQTIHDALALVTFDAGKGAYTFHSYTSEGRHQTNAEVTVENKKLIWQMNNSPSRKIRYTIWLDAQNRWQETGEMSTDQGKNWHKFFEMTLQRVQ